jgi:cobalt-zinc-cadmium efflux system membrane fusion protein
MRCDRRVLVWKSAKSAAVVGAALMGGLLAACSKESPPPRAADASAKGPPTLTLDPKQLGLVDIAATGEHDFPQEKQAVGNIDYDEDLSVQVSTPYQGKIIVPLAQMGDSVRKGQPLYTIESPDLVQAESTLIAAAGVLDLTNHALARAEHLIGQQGIAQKDLDQTRSDQMTAQGALAAAREAMKVFGKTDAEIDKIAASRKVDPVLIVRSPINGVVTVRNAQPGMTVQPGTPAPYAVADLSKKWMLADAAETDTALFKLGQAVRVSLSAYPGQVFEGKIAKIAPNVDPSVHTLQIRSEIPDPKGLLKPGMLANFVIQTAAAVKSPALAADSVVREPDGTNTAWVTTDRRHFIQRVVTVGIQHDGYDQILSGVNPGELAVGKGALFLDNMLNAPPED